MTKTVIFLQDVGREALQVLQREETVQGILTVIVATRQAQDILSRKGFDCRHLDEYGEGVDYNQVARQALDWIQEWPNTEIYQGKNFKELVTYKGVSLWWFIRFGLYNRVNEIIGNVRVAENVLDIEEPDHVVIIGDGAFGEIVKQSIGSRAISLTMIQEESGVLSELARLAKGYTRKVLIAAIKLLRCLQGKWRCRLLKKTMSPTKPNVLALTHSISWQVVTNPYSGKREKNDYQVGWVLKTLMDRGSVNLLAIDVGGSVKNSLKTFQGKGFPYIPLEAFSVPLRIKWAVGRRRKADSMLEEIWSNLSSLASFQRSLCLNGISLWPVLKGEFGAYFSSAFPGVIRNIEMARYILSRASVDTVFLTNEYGGTERSFVAAAQLDGIATVASQHGNIGSLHAGYMYGQGEIDRASAPICPVPDKTAVFGPCFKRLLLEKGGYPASKVVVTGQARTDVIAAKDRIYDREEVFSELGIEPHRKLLVFASQPLPDRRERKTVARALMKAMQELSSVFLVVKLHHGEQSGRIYNDFGAEFGISNYTVIQKVDLYRLLNASDVVMTVNSTVASEAILFDKPVILINLKSKDIMGYLQRGVALGVFEPRDLVPTIREALENPAVTRRLDKVRAEFVRDNNYRIDGQASERIADLVGEMTRA